MKNVASKPKFVVVVVSHRASGLPNLFTITKYSGLDPEVRTSGYNMGIDAGAWPTARQFLIGLRIGI
ncbi:unnamed protein product [marine sediment metagenome]|uniref:Uncharacterized protein n=1 Tax=marine sediment metagenome TaxID=412755 RepID=X1PWW6_9ZZZZ